MLPGSGGHRAAGADLGVRERLPDAGRDGGPGLRARGGPGRGARQGRGPHPGGQQVGETLNVTIILGSFPCTSTV